MAPNLFFVIVLKFIVLILTLAIIVDSIIVHSMMDNINRRDK